MEQKSGFRWQVLAASVCCAALLAAMPAHAATPPQAITIGTLYASTGPFATSSEAEYSGLKFWVDEENKAGGVPVKEFDNKRIPLKLVAYDDQSSTSTATTLYDQLISRDKVDILVADFGSVLTSVAVPLAQEHKYLLFDPSGTSASFFTKDNPYIVLTSLPTSGVWPETLAGFITEHKIDRVAVLFDSNDFDESQAITIKTLLTKAGNAPIYYHAVPTSTSNYTVLLHSIDATHPNAVLEFGYPNNDIAFLQALSTSGRHLNMVYTVFPGQLLQLLLSNVGGEALAYTFTSPTPPQLRYNQVNYGLGIDAFEKAYHAATGKDVNFLTVAGYNAGLAIGKALESASSLDQLALRKAVADYSGKLVTLDGRFEIRDDGAQIGETLPVGQFHGVPDAESNRIVVVYPADMANGKAVYPAPKR